MPFEACCKGIIFLFARRQWQDYRRLPRPERSHECCNPDLRFDPSYVVASCLLLVVLTNQVHYLKNPTDVQGTFRKLPFFMDAEKSMMQALVKSGPKAYVDALKAVPKNLQLMYL